MLDFLRKLFFVLIAFAMLLACGCSSADGLPGGNGSSFRVELLEESIHGSTGTGINHELESSGDRVLLRIRSGQDSGMLAAYVEVSFDSHVWQLDSVEPISMDAGGSQWVSLAVQGAEGYLQLGIAAVGLDERPGLSDPEELATLVFTRNPGGRLDYSTTRTSTAAPTNSGSQSTLAIDQPGGKLSWEYRCTGDYDQNGLVSISDLTPLGIHFGKSGPFSGTSIEGVVDGDGNGEINLGDITPIGQNFGRGVESYNIYVSTSSTDYPPSGSAASTIAAAGSYPFSSASGTPSSQRLQFVRTTLITPDRTYWVRPVHQGLEGIASTTAESIVIAPEPPVADLTADPTNGIAPLLVELDASGSTDANGNIDHYDWDFENDGTYDATTTVPQISRSYGGGPWTAKVRVVDSGGLSDTATVNLVFTQPEWNISTVDSYAPIYNYPVMIHTGSRPVIIYDQYNFDPIHDRLFFVRGTDTQGSSWTSPIRLDLSMDLVGDFDLDMVDGRAAICYYDISNSRFRYMRSNADDTSSWGNPITLETDDNALNTYGKSCSLEVVGGLPHVAFRGNSQLQIYIKAATDAGGTAWASRSLVSPALVKVGGITLIDASGRPGILWSSILEARVGYVHQNEVSGQFINTDLYNAIPQLANDVAYHQGKPLALYLTGNPTFDARVAVAGDADGTAWESAHVLGSSSQNGCSMAVVNGMPMIVYCSLGSNQLLFHRALDPSGSSWSTEEVIDDGGGGLVSEPCLIDVSGTPAVAYAWGDDPDYELRYAIYF